MGGSSKCWAVEDAFCSACHALLPANKGTALECRATSSVIQAFYTPSHPNYGRPCYKVVFGDELHTCTDNTPVTEQPEKGWLEFLRRVGPTPGHARDCKEHAEYFCPPCWAGVSTQEEREAVNAACDGRVACYEPERYTGALCDDAVLRRRAYAHQGSHWTDTLRWESAGVECAGCRRELPKNAGTWRIGEAGVVCFYTPLSEPQPLHTADFQPPHWAAPGEPRRMVRVLDYVRRLSDSEAPSKYYCVLCWCPDTDEPDVQLIATEEELEATARVCRSHGIGVREKYDGDSECSGAVPDCPTPGVSRHGPAAALAQAAARAALRVGCILGNTFLPGASALSEVITTAGGALFLRSMSMGGPDAVLQSYDTSGDGVLSLAEIRTAMGHLQGRSEPRCIYMRALLRHLERLHLMYRIDPEAMAEHLQRAVGCGVMQKLVVTDLVKGHACQRDPLLVWGIVAWYRSKKQQKAASDAARAKSQASASGRQGQQAAQDALEASGGAVGGEAAELVVGELADLVLDRVGERLTHLAQDVTNLLDGIVSAAL